MINHSMVFRFFLCIIIPVIIACSRKEQHQEKENSLPPPSAIETEQESVEEFEALIKEYEDEDRDEWQQPDIILDLLGDLQNKSVADIGAGTGYFSFKIAKTADTVFAIDIDKRFIDYIEERKERLGYGLGENVTTILGKPTDPNLPTKVDIVFLVNTYSYIHNRSVYFKKVKNGLKKEGFVYIVDFKVKDIPVGPPASLRVSPFIAVKELEQAGFHNFKVDSTSLPYQYILKAF